jgi:PTS system mannose-specific IIB component
VIALVRVDNRLVHGQIVETWVPKLGIRRILVADDQCASNRLACSAMTLALPEDLPADVVAVDALDWAAAAAAPEPTLLLFREVEGLRRAAGRALPPGLLPRVNLGNVHFAPGRRPITPSVFLREEELGFLRDLAARGFPVEARGHPTPAPGGRGAVGRRFQRAG